MINKNEHSTKHISDLIYNFLTERRSFLNFAGIERECDLYPKQLDEFITKRLKYLDKTSIIKLAPVLNSLGLDIPPVEYTSTEILRCISKLSGFTVSFLKSKTKRKEVVEERQIALFFLKELNPDNPFYTLITIGKLIGGFKTSGNVLYAIKTVNNRCDTESLFRLKIQTYREYLTNKK